MSQRPKSPFLSGEGCIGLVLAIIAATAAMDWIVRSVLVLVGGGLVVHLFWRLHRHGVIKVTLCIAGVSALFAATWHPIWDDFSAKHPISITDNGITERALRFAQSASDLLGSLYQPWIVGALTAAVAIILAWWWRPFLKLRYEISWSWRRILAEEIWISASEAVQVIENSTWAQLRRPPSNIWETLGAVGLASGTLTKQQRDNMKFRHFLRMTLASFAENNPRSVKEVDGKQQYLKGKLEAFCSHALDEDAVKQFGDVPRVQVE